MSRQEEEIAVTGFDEKNVAHVGEIVQPATEKILDNNGDAAHEVGIDLYRQAADLTITPDESRRVYVP